MNKIEPGTILTYREMGEICSVEVIEDNSDEDEISLKLEVIGVIQKSSIAGPSIPGEQFVAWRPKKYPRQSDDWYIDELEEN